MNHELCPECDQPRPRDEEVEDLYARLEALTAENEGRKKSLFEKSEELAREWRRAERAEADLARLRAVLTPTHEWIREIAWKVSESCRSVPTAKAIEAVLAALSERAGIKL